MSNRFTQKAQNVLSAALNGAAEMGHTYIGSEHLLLGLSSEEDSIAARLLRAKGLQLSKVRARITDLSGCGSYCELSPSDMTPKLRRIIERSAELSSHGENSYIGTEHLLLALLEEKDSVALRIVEAEGVSLSQLIGDVSAFLSTASQGNRQGESKSEEKNKIHGAPTLSAHGRDLTALATRGQLDPVIGRERETERLIHILCRRSKNNPCLIGEPGVGKTAVVEGLALRMA